MYNSLAYLYDGLMDDFDYEAYTAFILPYLSGRGMDLACGSGRITCALADAGCEMTGVDSSADMLNVARERAGERNITWVMCDMSSLPVPRGEYDFITCVCDGFNYLTPSQLRRTVERIYKALPAGGRFIFDVSTPYKLKNVLGNRTYFYETEGVSYGWCNTLGKNHVDMDIVFFVRGEDGNYKRSEEFHRQYMHSHGFITSLLQGFEVQVYDGDKFTRAGSRSARRLYVCTKMPSEKM